MIVLDTNVVSELMRAEPDPRVLTWLAGQDGADTHTTAVTVAEIGYGIARLPAGRRRDTLRAAADDVFTEFGDKILPFDTTAARHYPEVVTERDHAGTPTSGFDAQIAAICRTHHATLITRNTNDFHGIGLTLVNPWEPAT